MPLQPYIGQIMPAGFAVIPRGWSLCNGSLLAISQWQALFSVIGSVYGGDGRSTFALPDLRGRAIMGTDARTIALGQSSGTETVALTTAQLPTHFHVLQASMGSSSGRGGTPINNLYGVATSGGETIFAYTGSKEVALEVGVNVRPAGGSQPHNNMQPFLVVNYMIALQGIYPSRN